MSLTIKTEPADVSIVDVSSDEDLSNMVSPTKNEIPTFRHPNRPGTPETHCSICLEEFTDRCYPNICIHMFCFECLKRWSTIDSSCPLCKKKFQQIYHSLSEYTHETYEVPRQERLSPRIFLRPFGELTDANRIFRMNLFLDIVRRNDRLMSTEFTDEDFNHNDFRTTSQLIGVNQPTNFNPGFHPFHERRSYSSTAVRTQVYTDNLWADPLPDLSGRFRDCSSSFFRENPAQVHRLQQFIVRDIHAIRAIENLRANSSVNEVYLTSLIMRSIITHEIRDPHITNILRPYFGVYAAHFCHELHNFANSPYDLMGYDRNVRYTPPLNYSPAYQSAINAFYDIGSPPTTISLPYHPQTMETIVLDSDDSVTEPGPRPVLSDVITIQSSSSDSDIEILSQSFHPDVFNSSRDQPSTSTGIRDSLDRPNIRYNLRKRRLFPPNINDSSGYPVHMSRMTYPPGLRRGRIILDSSSSDDESLTSAPSSQGVHLKSEVACARRKRKVKKNKSKKKKKTVDNSKSDKNVGSRNRSYSVSSSSDGDTDLPTNNCLPISTSTNVLL